MPSRSSARPRRGAGLPTAYFETRRSSSGAPIALEMFVPERHSAEIVSMVKTAQAGGSARRLSHALPGMSRIDLSDVMDRVDAYEKFLGVVVARMTRPRSASALETSEVGQGPGGTESPLGCVAVAELVPFTRGIANIGLVHAYAHEEAGAAALYEVEMLARWYGLRGLSFDLDGAAHPLIPTLEAAGFTKKSSLGGAGFFKALTSVTLSDPPSPPFEEAS